MRYDFIIVYAFLTVSYITTSYGQDGCNEYLTWVEGETDWEGNKPTIISCSYNCSTPIRTQWYTVKNGADQEVYDCIHGSPEFSGPKGDFVGRVNLTDNMDRNETILDVFSVECDDEGIWKCRVFTSLCGGGVDGTRGITVFEPLSEEQLFFTYSETETSNNTSSIEADIGKEISIVETTSENEVYVGVNLVGKSAPAWNASCYVDDYPLEIHPSCEGNFTDCPSSKVCSAANSTLVAVNQEPITVTCTLIVTDTVEYKITAKYGLVKIGTTGEDLEWWEIFLIVLGCVVGIVGIIALIRGISVRSASNVS